MNWTGGARARASKASSGAVTRQKQYFAKVRARMVSNAFMGGSSSGRECEEDDGGAVSIIIKKRQKQLQDFEVVIGAEKEKQKRQLEDEMDPTKAKRRKRLLFSEDIESIPKLGKRKIAVKKENIKSRKNMILQQGDWVRTKMAAPLKPLALQTRTERKPFKTRLITSPASPFPRQSPGARPVPSLGRKGSQAFTHDPSEYEHSDTGFNAFKLLSQGGYIRIGKGKPLVRNFSTIVRDQRLREMGESGRSDSHDTMLLNTEETWRLSETPFELIEDGGYVPVAALEGKSKAKRQFLTRYHSEELESDPFEPIMSPDPAPEEDNVGSRFIGSQQPTPGTKQKLVLDEDEDIEEEIEKEDIFLCRNLSRSSRPPASRFRARPKPDTKGIDELLRQIDEVATDASLPNFPAPIEELRPRSKTQSSPTSYVTHFISCGVQAEASEVVRTRELPVILESIEHMSFPEGTDSQEDEQLPQPNKINASVVVHAPSSRDSTSSENTGKDGSDGNDVGNEQVRQVDDREKIWTEFFHFSSCDEDSSKAGEIYSSVREQRGTPIGGQDPPKKFPAAIIITSGKANEIGHDVEASEIGILPTEAASGLVLVKEKSLNKAETAWREFMSMDLKPTSPKNPATSTYNLESPAIKLSLTKAEDLAWRNFVFAGPEPDSSDEDEYIYTALKYPDGKHYTALTPATPLTSSPSPFKMEPMPYFPSPTRVSRGSLTPVGTSAKGSAGDLPDSIAGNASLSVLSPSSRGSIKANPSSSDGGNGQISRRCPPYTFTRPKRFVGYTVAAVAAMSNERVEEIEDW
jgi:hypothetical protein